MSFANSLRKTLFDLTGFWISRHRDMSVGADLVTDLKQKICLPMKTIFDVGANIGQMSLRFHESFSGAKIYSFEPVSNTFKQLESNVKHSSRISCNKLALGDQVGALDIKLFDDELSVLNSLNEKAMNKSENHKIERIEVTTGDKFCLENQITEIDLLKIDTEGYEIPVLKGFSKMLEESKIKALYVETGFSPGNTRNTFINELTIFALQKGYSFYGMYEISNIQIKTGTNYGNILFVNDSTL